MGSRCSPCPMTGSSPCLGSTAGCDEVGNLAGSACRTDE
jgi:hypothetical protein